MITKEIFTLSQGALGPLQEGFSIELCPITVLIGEQGVGKSLASQMLYFLRDMPYLLYTYHSAAEVGTPEALVKWVADRIRSGRSGRRLASLVPRDSRAARLVWEERGRRRAISINRKSRTVKPLKSEWKGKWIEEWMAGWKEKQGKELIQRAVFIPPERNLFSRFGFPTIGNLSNVPLFEFAKLLDEAGDRYDQWERGEEQRSPEVQWVDRWGWRALKGRVRYAKRGLYAGYWQWIPEGSDDPIEIDMASSGQIEAWPLVVIAEYLLGLPREERPLYIHIEEPEAHLHPAAQVRMIHLLAYLANHGFRVLITTHSLTVLYTLNNLLLAGMLLPEQAEKVESPPVGTHLPPGSVSAYLIDEKEGVVDLFDPEQGLFSEVELGRVNGVLEGEMNNLEWLLTEYAEANNDSQLVGEGAEE